MGVTVSVIFAVHNGENGLTAALDSIKKQSLHDIEVIMVDAASDDETAKIMSAYPDKRFSYHRIDSTDIAQARNKGLELACGKYVGFCDSNVSFTENLFSDMLDYTQRVQAQLCVSQMASSDVYGRHVFTSTGHLSRRSKTDKFDMDLIWNPSVSNKLFLREVIEEHGFRFGNYGKAQDAVFSLAFAFVSDSIACCPKGFTVYTVPMSDEGVAKASIQNYRDAYDTIVKNADEAFENEIHNSLTEFNAKELEKLSVCYADSVRCKEITVLLYSYYRHFWSLSDAEIEHYTQILTELCKTLSSKGQISLFNKNKDIFYDGRLIDNKKEISENPRVTVCMGRCDNRGHFDTERMRIELDSIYGQTMPNFELFIDSRLREFIPEEYLERENITFIESMSISDFKQSSLEHSHTGYIMFLDGYVRLNPKILMRHYNALFEKTNFGFSTSPLTRFDGKQTQRYKFSDFAFFKNMRDVRSTDSDAYVLDLFFCNKLFRVEHLRGIHFTFTDNTLFDMYKLYELCKFKKLSHRGTYFPYSEEEVMGFLKAEESYLPENCRRMFRHYKTSYFKGVNIDARLRKLKSRLKRIKAVLLSRFGILLRNFFAHLPLKDRVLFYSIRANGKLVENSKAVYEAYDGDKVVYSKMLPHSTKELAKIYFLLLTSKVIVTDDYLKYLRVFRLRPQQKVIQIWHAGGAFKRFGLDAPSKLTNLEEYKTHSQYSDVCVTSEYVRQFYAHAFGVDMSIVKALGSPRTDLLYNKDNLNRLRENIYERHPLLRDKKVVVYLPTFREIKGSRVYFNPKIDWEELDSQLSDDEVFIISRHPVMKYEYIKDKHYSRLKDYTDDPTPELIAVADVIVTDYSSVIFDASLIGCPTVFYCPDFDNYERDFYLEYPDDLPGPVVYEPQELLSTIRQTIAQPPQELISKFLEKEMSACDGHSVERVVELIKGYISK